MVVLKLPRPVQRFSRRQQRPIRPLRAARVVVDIKRPPPKQLSRATRKTTGPLTVLARQDRLTVLVSTAIAGTSRPILVRRRAPLSPPTTTARPRQLGRPPSRWRTSHRGQPSPKRRTQRHRLGLSHARQFGNAGLVAATADTATVTLIVVAATSRSLHLARSNRRVSGCGHRLEATRPVLPKTGRTPLTATRPLGPSVSQHKEAAAVGLLLISPLPLAVTFSRPTVLVRLLVASRPRPRSRCLRQDARSAKTAVDRPVLVEIRLTAA